MKKRLLSALLALTMIAGSTAGLTLPARAADTWETREIDLTFTPKNPASPNGTLTGATVTSTGAGAVEIVLHWQAQPSKQAVFGAIWGGYAEEYNGFRADGITTAVQTDLTGAKSEKIYYAGHNLLDTTTVDVSLPQSGSFPAISLENMWYDLDDNCADEAEGRKVYIGYTGDVNELSGNYGASTDAFEWASFSFDASGNLAIAESESTAKITELKDGTAATWTGVGTNSDILNADATVTPAKLVGTAEDMDGAAVKLKGVKVAVSKTVDDTTTWFNGTGFTAETPAWNSATKTGVDWGNWSYTLPSGVTTTDAAYRFYAYATDTTGTGVPTETGTGDATKPEDWSVTKVDDTGLTVDVTRPTVTPDASLRTPAGSTFQMKFSEDLSTLLGTTGTPVATGNLDLTGLTIKHASAQADAATGTSLTATTDYTAAYNSTTKTMTITFVNALTQNDYYYFEIANGKIMDAAGNKSHAGNPYSVTVKAVDKADATEAMQAWANGDTDPAVNAYYSPTASADAAKNQFVYDGSPVEIAPSTAQTELITDIYLTGAEKTAISDILTALAAPAGTTLKTNELTAKYYVNTGTAAAPAKGAAADGVSDTNAPTNAGSYVMELTADTTYFTGSVLVPFTITPMPVVLDGTFAKTFDGTEDFVLADLKDAEGAAKVTVSAKTGYTLPANTEVTVTGVTAAESVDNTGAVQTNASALPYSLKITGYQLSASAGGGAAAVTANYYLDNTENMTDAAQAVTIAGKAKIAPYVIDGTKLAKYITAITKAYDATTNLPNFSTTDAGYTKSADTSYAAGVFTLDVATGESAVSLGSVQINGLTGAIGTTGNVTAAPEAVKLTAVSLVPSETHANNTNFLFVGADGKTAPSAENPMTLGDIGTITQNTTTYELKAKNVSVETGAVSGLKMGSFVSSTPALTDPESTEKMFSDAITLTNGVIAAEGMKITFYTDTARTQAYDQASLPTSSAQTLYFTIAADDAAPAPSTNTNYANLTFDATAGALDGTLTITKNDGGGSGGGGGGSSSYTVKFDAGKNGKITKGNASTSVSSGSKVAASKVPEVTANEGYKFLGWSLDGKTTVDPTAQKITKSVTFTALYEGAETPELNKDEHMAYIKGYTDGAFKPGNDITRAEVAAIFARIVKNEIGMDGTTSFSDVKTDAWYAPSVAAMQKFGMLKGYPDGTFRPDAPITREEFTAMATRMGEITKAGSLPFADVKADSWSADNIYTAYTAGWIAGYEDGTFRPSANLTRAEAVKMVNAMLERTITAETIAGKQYKTFSDVPSTHWAYYDVIEASNAHAFTKDAGKETWK